MVSLTVVEELAMQTWPGFNHAAVNLPDEKKGEKIILVTDCRNANRRQMQETARILYYSELCIPRNVLIAEELPLLGTGKINYIRLTEIVRAEENENQGWLAKFTSLVKKSEADEENPEGEEPGHEA